MKIDFISFSNNRGGAAKAMFRLARLMECNNYQITKFYVENEKSDLTPNLFLIKRLLCLFLLKLMRTSNYTKHSLGFFSNKKLTQSITNSSADIFHIHWVNNEALSVRDIVKTSNIKNTVITLHDEWLYLGCQHYRNLDGSDGRFFGEERFNYDFGKILDLDSLNYFLKKSLFTKFSNRTQIVVPSNWMKEQVEDSKLLSKLKVNVIPNVIDEDVFCPKNNKDASSFTIAFGAVGGASNPMKGYDLLVKALSIFSQKVTNSRKVKILVFGKDTTNKTNLSGFDVEFSGHIADEAKLAEVYSRSDIVVVPSRLESFGQVAAESISCGTPVVCFETSGLKDIVEHKVNGYFAKAFDCSDLSEGISYFYNMSSNEYAEFGLNTRKTAINKFSKKVVLDKYSKLYKELQ